MPENVQFGTVTFFNAEKGYGFIESDELGPRVFFHITDRGGTRINTSYSPRFAQDLVLVSISDCSDIPKVGDRMVFHCYENVQGLQADPWTFERKWLAAQAELIEPRYKVVRKREVVAKGRKEPSYTLVFAGTLEELDEEYPKPYDGEDSLSPTVTLLLEARFLFFLNTGNGWEECADPRHRQSRRQALAAASR